MENYNQRITKSIEEMMKEDLSKRIKMGIKYSKMKKNKKENTSNKKKVNKDNLER